MKGQVIHGWIRPNGGRIRHPAAKVFCKKCENIVAVNWRNKSVKAVTAKTLCSKQQSHHPTVESPTPVKTKSLQSVRSRLKVVTTKRSALHGTLQLNRKTTSWAAQHAQSSSGTPP